VKGNVRFALVLAVSLLAIAPVSAENFRGEVIDIHVVENSDTGRYRLRAGQVLVVTVDPAYPFVSGIEFVVDPGDRSFQQEFSFSLFGSVDPPVDRGIANLVGVDLASSVLTGALPRSFTVPFVDSGSVSSAPGAVRTTPADPSTGAIAVQLVPIMKGMTSESVSRDVGVVVRPLIRQVGALRVRLDGEPDVVDRALDRLEIDVNGTAIDPEQLVELPPGIYRLRAVAGDLLDFTGNVGIEAGRIEVLTLPVEEPRANVRFNVPSIADVFWNGERVRGSTISAPPGTHTLVIRLGDFSVSRRVELEGDGRYRIGLDLDILVNRD
jgi:hypothetical protein